MTEIIKQSNQKSSKYFIINIKLNNKDYNNIEKWFISKLNYNLYNFNIISNVYENIVEFIIHIDNKLDNIIKINPEEILQSLTDEPKNITSIYIEGIEQNIAAFKWWNFVVKKEYITKPVWKNNQDGSWFNNNNNTYKFVYQNYPIDAL